MMLLVTIRTQQFDLLRLCGLDDVRWATFPSGQATEPVWMMN
jgi:hypothetical protein